MTGNPLSGSRLLLPSRRWSLVASRLPQHLSSPTHTLARLSSDPHGNSGDGSRSPRKLPSRVISRTHASWKRDSSRTPEWQSKDLLLPLPCFPHRQRQARYYSSPSIRSPPRASPTAAAAAASARRQLSLIRHPSHFDLAHLDIHLLLSFTL